MTELWSSVETFSIESATGNNYVYANGRQSIKLRLAIKVVNDKNEPVALSEKERLTITLIDYDGKEIKYRHENDLTPVESKYGRWDWSVFNNGDYLYYPSQGAGGRSLSDKSAVGASDDPAYVYLYVRTISQTPLELGVRITREDGKKFDSRRLADGMTKVIPVRPPTYRPTDYRLRETVMQPYRMLQGGVNFLSYYSLELASDQYVGFRHLQPMGLLLIFTGYLDTAEMVGYVQPGDSVVNYPVSLKYAPTDIGAFRGDGKILLVRTAVMAAKNKYFGALEGRQDVTMCPINAIDEYGNSHKLNLRSQRFAASDGKLELV